MIHLDHIPNVMPHGVFNERQYWEAQVSAAEELLNTARKKLAQLAMPELNKTNGEK